MMMTAEIDKLAAALAKAQGAMSAAEKDSSNPHFKSRFASLASVREAIRAPLSENGLAYVQTIRTIEGAVEVETRLIHESGQSIGDVLAVPLGQATPQGVGSASSYGRRYALMAIVGLAAEDDDADAAQRLTPERLEQRNAYRNGDASRLAYLDECRAKILGENETEETIRVWWAGAAQARRDFGLNNLQIGLLKSLMAERFKPKPYVPIEKVAQ